jgi:hypothetical protein
MQVNYKVFIKNFNQCRVKKKATLLLVAFSILN